MTPDQLAKSNSEHSHQRAFFAYVAVARQRGFDAANMWASGQDLADIPQNGSEGPLIRVRSALQWIHAIPNGGLRDKKTAAILKAEGVKRGIADIFLPYPSGEWHGLYIEMKKPSQKPKKKSSKGGMSNEQIEFQNYCRSVDFGFVTCYSWKEAAIVLRQYIEWSE